MAGKVKDMTGVKSNRWTVLRKSENTTYNKAAKKEYWNGKWVCECECGTIREVNGAALRQKTSMSCGCYQKEAASKSSTVDMTGKKYNWLTGVKRVGVKNDSVMWLFKCDCGNEKIAPGANVRSGDTQSCGCVKKYRVQQKLRLAKGESAFNALYYRYKKEAANRGYSFNVSKEDFRKITSENCHYCGTTPQQCTNANIRYGNYIYNGLDRVDNEQGYSKENCVPCCGKCNRAKDTMTYNQFKELISSIYNNMELNK